MVHDFNLEEEMKKIKEEELFSLDATLTEYILPRLVLFRNSEIQSYPSRLSGTEEWESILDKIINSFQMHINDSFSIDNYDEDIRVFNEGMKLFAEYYCDLWL